MSWRYSQSTGDLARLVNGAVVFTVVKTGYSGHAEGLNNPDMEHVRGVGPIPRGQWRIGPPYDSDSLGPYTLPLWYLEDGNFDDSAAYGRSAFRVHGDNSARNRSASHGCIVLPRKVRELIAESSDSLLEVIA